jgi:hypothetical protein
VCAGIAKSTGRLNGQCAGGTTWYWPSRRSAWWTRRSAARCASRWRFPIWACSVRRSAFHVCTCRSSDRRAGPGACGRFHVVTLIVAAGFLLEPPGGGWHSLGAALLGTLLLGLGSRRGPPSLSFDPHEDSARGESSTWIVRLCEAHVNALPARRAHPTCARDRTGHLDGKAPQCDLTNSPTASASVRQ